ncbi:3378_t:CDS:2 [Entrophospora sp. SA101]|nr:14212_t:CDS:2 [Entrophospora sp. SA101]CAJ0747560.1 3378_t:CDS:2 [Entrophospora sp. SA101]
MKTLSISIQDKTYQELKQQIGSGQISQLVDKLITEELSRRKQKLIAGYKRVAKSQAMKKEAKRGGEIKKTRPSLVVSNDTQNEFDDQIIVAPLTTEEAEPTEDFEVFIANSPDNGLEKPSKILLNRLQTIDKVVRLKGLVGKVSLEIKQQC